ncbi:hypothetical protein, partial [Amycolatopsis magusensis]|uniref:hypothetical protein n=1 Tax=Amycolatopsis magusensis TaxID=882444 RepID=UPI003C2CEE82
TSPQRERCPLGRTTPHPSRLTNPANLSGQSTSSAVLAPTADVAAYGYMRVPCDVADRKVLAAEQNLRAFANDQALNLERVFYETVCGSHDAFDALTEELARSGVRYVVTPSLRHLAKNRFLQNSMLYRLELAAAATVLELKA